MSAELELIHIAGRQAFQYGQTVNPYADEFYRAAWQAGYDEAEAEFDAWLDSHGDVTVQELKL